MKPCSSSIDHRLELEYTVYLSHPKNIFLVNVQYLSFDKMFDINNQCNVYSMFLVKPPDYSNLCIFRAAGPRSGHQLHTALLSSQG